MQRNFHPRNWSYEQHIYSIYRMIRYLSMSINVENFRDGCLGYAQPSNGDGREFFNTALGGCPDIPHFAMNQHDSIINQFSPSFSVDFSKHAVISHPWSKDRIVNCSMLTDIKDTKHDFLDPKFVKSDPIKFDLILPWGIAIISENGNHRAMGAILSGAGSMPISCIGRAYDFESFILNIDPAIIDEYSTPLGRALYEIALLMSQTAKLHGQSIIGQNWFTHY